ncbi:MAG: MFS transporter [Puniceicoccaceae bacterium]|nr:MAG: MFS transporter [Puniceicoccaceae bacterium]
MSIYDGAFATMMASLCGGIFLVGFALNVLEANALQVGLLAAMPVSANMAQIIGSIIVERYGRRRVLCLICVTAARLLWLPILGLPFLVFGEVADPRIWLLVLLVGASCLLGSISGVAWLGWMSDIIPSDIRGRFFARRNIVCAAAGMVVILAGGAFLNFSEAQFGRESPTGYVILFSIGIVLGLIASYFLYRVHDPKSGQTPPAGGVTRAALFSPFRDGNFRALIVYVALFMFVTQMAGPFYAVYMIENLQVDFGTITWLITFATLASLFMLRFWGPIADEMGNRPILLVAGFAHALIPLIWVVAQEGAYYHALVLAHIASGAFFAALMLAHVNILIKLSPEKGRSFYIAAFNMSIGLAVAVAPILGGVFLSLTEGWQMQTGRWTVNNLHALFLLSGALQIVVLFTLIGLREEGSSSPRAVLLQLRNDLDPQTGLASAMDFVSVRAGRTGRVLKTIDERTDDWSARSEAMIDRRLAALETRFAKPLAHLRRLFSPPS